MTYKKKVLGIYMITNLQTKEVYIGSSVNCLNRICDHKKELRKNKHHSRILQASFNEYGESNFSFEIIEQHENVDKSFLYERENFYLNENRDNLLNTAPRAESIKGVKRTDEHKKLSSERAKKTFKGVTKSAEHKEKLSKAKLGRKRSPETIEKIRQAALKQMSDPNMRKLLSDKAKGRKVSEEVKKKISASSKKLWDNEEYRNKVNEARRIAVNSKEYKQKQSEASKERWQDPKFRNKVNEARNAAINTEDYKQKRSKASKKLWQDPEYREKKMNSMKNIYKDEEYRNKISISLKKKNIEKYRNKILELEKLISSLE